MIFKRTVLTKVLDNGMKAEFSIALDEGMHKAALYLNGRPIPGPALPQPLTTPKGEVTHWMGNRPSVGLTCDEAEKIIREVELENSVLLHRQKKT